MNSSNFLYDSCVPLTRKEMNTLLKSYECQVVTKKKKSRKEKTNHAS